VAKPTKGKAVLEMDEAAANARALGQAQQAVLDALVDLARLEPSEPRTSSLGGMNLMRQDEPDPLGDLVEEHDDLAERWGEEISHTMLTTAAAIAAEAIAELAKLTGQKPGRIARQIAAKALADD
jgi:hypothetical protein